MLVTVQVKVVGPSSPRESVAVTVTEEVPAVVGVPVTVPVEALIDSPAGRPVADQVERRASTRSRWPEVTGAMAVPETEAWGPG